MLKKLGLLSIATASLMAMHEFELNINDVDLETGLKLDMGQFNNAVEPNTTFFGFKFLKGDEEHSDYEDPSSYLETNFMIQREIKNGFYAGIGIKLNYISADEIDADFMSFPLGIKVGYRYGDIIFPITASAEVHYAPQVLSIQDAKNYLEYRINVDFEVIKNGSINLGFRDLETKYDVSKVDSEYYVFDRSAYIGFKFNF